MQHQAQREAGRDEMNLAEFPLGVLSERVPAGVKTLVFEGHQGRLTVTGSDLLGLPTPLDTDVLIALLHLTKLQNNFESPTVTFSRYEVLNMLGMSDDGKSFQRLKMAMRRWVGVTLFYDGSFWDNALKCRVEAAFHVLDDVTMFDMKVRRTLGARQQPLPLSSFTWGSRFFASCQADNLKRLDLTTYFGLRSAVSKQLYRYADKKFYVRPDWTFDLRELAFAHVGLSRTYADAKIKEKLAPALAELEGIGFLRPMPTAERYAKIGRGHWTIRLARKGRATSHPLGQGEPLPLTGDDVQGGGGQIPPACC
jgi:plasmid replication initiation protein